MHHGTKLFGEWKREDEEIKQGQKILLKELAWIHRVLLITGYVDDAPHITLIQEVLPATGNLKVVGKSVADLMKYIQDWYKNAEEENARTLRNSTKRARAVRSTPSRLSVSERAS